MSDEFFWTRQELTRASRKELARIADFYGVEAGDRESMIVGILTRQHDADDLLQ